MAECELGKFSARRLFSAKLLGEKLGSVHTLLLNRTSECVLGRPTRTGPSSTLVNLLRKPGEAKQMKGKQAPRVRAGKDSPETPK